MPTYSMRAPDGKVYRITGPAGATEDQVRQQILAQHPQAGLVASSPQNRPTLSVQSTQPRPQPTVQNQPGNFFARLMNSAGGAVDKYAPAVSATYRGMQDAIPGIDHIAAGANELGTLIGANKSNLPYSDRVKAIRAAREAAMNQDVHGPSTGVAIGHYVGEVGGLLGGGAGIARGTGNILAKVAPRVMAATSAAARVAPRSTNVISKVALNPVSKISAAGATGGAVYGAGNSTGLGDLASNTAEGAAAGAVAAPVVAGGAKLAEVLTRPLRDAVGLSNAAEIMKRYVKTSAEDLQKRYTDFVQRTGGQPTMFELLPLDDRQSVQRMIGILPSGTKEKAAYAVQQRAHEIGPEMTAKAREIIAPQRQQIVDQFAGDIARSRGETTPTSQDIELATRAARDPASLDEVRRTVNKNIMYPHDGRSVAGSVDSLVPQAPTRLPDGSIKMEETNPDLSRMIRSAAGVQNLDEQPVTVSDLTSMISKLKKIANGNGTAIERQAASDSVKHLESELQARQPQAFDAYQKMSASNQNYRQVAEGWKAGLQSDLRENVDPTGNMQLVRNQYDTPSGAQGRVLGQASRLEQDFGSRPGQSLGATQDVATSPNTQEAINRNLGAVSSPVTPAGTAAPGAGTQLADAAAAQTESAQNLSRLNAEDPGPAADLPTIAANLIRMDSFSSASKAQAVNNLLRMFTKLPQGASSQLVDALLSRDPTKVSAGLKLLNNAGSVGQDALRQLGRAVTTGGLVGSVGTSVQAPDGEHLVGVGQNEDGTSYPQYGTAEPDPGIVDPAAAEPAPQPGDMPSGTPVDPEQSPYMAQLQKVYDTGDHTLLSLANQLEGKESQHQQFDAQGRPLQSKAGAVGIMQVMPATAQGIAQQRGIQYDPTALHYDPAYNKLLGVHVLDQLLTKYNGDKVKAAAAYNWHPDALDATIKAHPDDWQNYLPKETRDYVSDIQ